MKWMKFSISLFITLLLVFLLDNRWTIMGNPVPPLGKFLDPFHGFWQNIEAEDHTLPGTLEIEGLRDKVTVIFDSLQIPHIFAANEEDLYKAQGYVTAIHRLWQMEFQTHAAAGRISEIIGPGKNDGALSFDRNQRRLGMVFGAENALRSLQENPHTKMILENYTAGVNQYIESLGYKDLPLEYKILDYSPEPWTPLKCGLLLKYMAQTLNIGEKDMQMTNALKLFGKDMVAVLYPDREPVGDAIVEKPGEWKFDPVKLDTIPLALPDELIRITGLRAADPNVGSNNWAVSGSKTETGAPVLCNDPHLDLSLPSIWYAIQLQAPGINTMGVSLPGSPCVIVGFNDSIAWGVTNAQRDLADWYAITFQNDSKDKYLLDEQWLDTKKVVEKFEVRDHEMFYDTVVYTQWGPVPYDETFRSENNRKHYAFRWIAHDASDELMTFYKLNRAKNYDDYTDALNHYSSPAQNFVFASASGDIAMRIQGKYPVRRPLEGKFVLDGSKSLNGWQAFIPFEQNVMYKNPERGFVSSANQYPADSTYPYYITATSFEAYRNRRINEVLQNDTSITVNDMMALQNDNYNLKAAESLPIFLSYVDSTAAGHAEAYKKLNSWDFVNDVDSEAASYYEAWWDNLRPLIWDEMDQEGLSLYTPTTFNTIRLIKEQPGLSFFDIQSTPEKETAGDVIRKAFTLAMEDMEKWKASRHQGGMVDPTPRWADFKDTYIQHLMQLEPLSYHVQHGGNHDIVNASSRRHGPSWRMVVSLEKSGIKAFAVYPGGQSGNPGSIHYNSMLDRWTHGEYFSLIFFQKQDDANSDRFHTLQLNPPSK